MRVNIMGVTILKMNVKDNGQCGENYIKYIPDFFTYVQGTCDFLFCCDLHFHRNG